MRKVIYLALFILVFRLGQYYFLPFKPQFRAGDRVRINSCLDTEPRQYRRRQAFTLAGVQIIAPTEPRYSFGDCLEIVGTVQPVEKRGRKIWRVEADEISKKDADYYWRVKKLAKAVQERAVAVYRRWLPEPEASLVAGIVLGAKSKLPTDFFESLKITGTLHIVVASGYNLTVISRRPVEGAAWLVGRKLGLVAGWLAIWGYALISGGEPPVVRAAIIISLVYLAQFLGRQFSVWRGFFLAVWLMLSVQPELLTSISFQLSVAAMVGLLLFENKWERLRKIPLIGKDMVDSLSVQLLVAPVIAYHFGQISWMAPVINGLVLSLVPKIMIFGLVGLIGIITPILAVPFLYLLYPLAWLFVAVVKTLGKLPWLNIPLPLSLVGLLIYFLVLFLVLKVMSKKKAVRNNN